MLQPGATIAFYGDSITTGWRSITGPDKRWTARVCAEYGWTELNVARGGMGFVRWRGERPSEDQPREHTGESLGLLADVLASDADACVVALGCNDSVLVNEDRRTGATRWTTELRRAIERDLDLLLERFGPARLAVFDLYRLFPFNEAGLPADGSELPPGWLSVRAQLVPACEQRGIRLLDATAPEVHRGDRFGPDGIHPNDQGHAALADALGPRLFAHFAAA
ncbi:SGNH/GDSL hydrolase family protein [Microbacterium horticulturae]|uniref:SGNH/GDSL hydrolase family protein n=1 Tax=Microbacterium horticulturae TaxID=3028316 RepID=A0ABY8BXF5_9MICO|nr:SGNH/GDSL hydrolase family protein [Microbacterium sp. KACC 23027]WEG08875.1 SGNH/GDSL hydrolase family protein [Microbacterium sp. KACC 23027]